MTAMPRIRTNRGFSLVELMIASVLGLMVVAFVATIFLSGNRNYAQDERFARMQENGRFVLNRLAEELSNAEYWGGMTTSDPASSGVRDFSNIATVLATSDCGVNFTPGNSTRALGNVNATTASTAFNCINASSFRNGTDVLLVQKVINPPATPAAGSANPFNTQKVYLRTNTSSGMLIQSATEPTDISATYTIPSQNWTYWEYAPAIYYIQDSGIPSLHRLKLGPALTMEDELLTEGIEAIHVLFGIDTDSTPDGIANQYKSNPTAAELAEAVNARIYVLVRSIDKDPNYTDSKTYTLGDLCYKVGGTAPCNALTDASTTPEPEKYHRRVFSSTVMLRNPAFRAQFSQ